MIFVVLNEILSLTCLIISAKLHMCEPPVLNSAIKLLWRQCSDVRARCGDKREKEREREREREREIETIQNKNDFYFSKAIKYFCLLRRFA